MGSSHSSRNPEDEVDDDDDDEVEGEDEEEEEKRRRSRPDRTKEKVLEQEPEIPPSGAPATPLSAAATPRLPLPHGVRIWDPTNLLLRPLTPRRFDSGAGDPPPEAAAVEVFLVNHGECGVSQRPDLVGGRWPTAALTAAGERQVRALAVFLKSQRVRFTSVYASPLVRARASAALVCQELDFPKEQIQFSDALLEMSQGQWEGCLRSEVYSLEMVSLINRTEPDFSAPSGESLREVEFRMIEFLNRRVLRPPEKLRIDPFPHQDEVKGFTSYSSTNSVREQDGPDMNRYNRPGLARKKSGKSRLQFVATAYNENEIEDELSPREDNRRHLLHEANTRNPTDSVAIFTHATPIKCLLTGLLNCSPMVSHKICIDVSSVTVLQHSIRTGWRIKRLNDTSHLQLL